MPYIPSRGDIACVDFDPKRGHEQAGRRPALIVSQRYYNERTGLLICCPITARTKNYPFEVTLPDGLPTTGVVLSNHITSIDWRIREIRFICEAPEGIIDEALAKFQTIVERELT